MPALCRENEEEDALDAENSGDEDDWMELEEQCEPVTCLFCPKILDSIDIGVVHIKDDHDFDLAQVKSKHGLDQYLYIKMINYIRKLKPFPKDITTASVCLWDHDHYLQPAHFEPWLTYDIESLKVSEKENGERSGKTITIPLDEYNEMKSRIEELETLLQLSRNNFMTFLEKELKTNGTSQLDITSATSKSNTRENDKEKDDDDGYFSTYSHFGIHHDMLSDEIRTTSYQQAIMKNSDLFRGKVVLDVGCGTGILSMFASRAGAKEVYAIDQSDIIYQAMDIAQGNGIKNIKFIKGRLEDVTLPVKEVDIIISEWMGYFLMFEGMLDSVIYARKHYLCENGLLLPNRCNISILGYGDVERHEKFVNFWSDVYGFNMACMQRECLREVSVENCKAEYILTDSTVVCDLNLLQVDLDYSNFDFKFTLNVNQDGTLTSFVGYFDTFFELIDAVMFSTSPAAKCTHWKQVVFYFKNPVSVKKGDQIEGTFVCRRARRDVRGLNITIHVFGQTCEFMLV